MPGTLSDWFALVSGLAQHVVASDVLPREMPEPLESWLSALSEAIDGVRRAISEAHARYSSDPSATFLRGRRLTREEYYIIRVMGIDFGSAKQLELFEFEDYELFSLLCAETDAAVFYINGQEEAGEPGIDGLLGRDFLDQFTVTIDTAAGRVTLRPR